ncbi:MAG: hypothetical protein ABR531_03845 [Bacteroidales bacterium]
MMKKKILLATIAVAAMTTMAAAADRDPSGTGPRSANGSQQVIVNNYYLQGGYEYTSRLKRFHTSYVTFDFYSSMYTEVYWYRGTPYTWGVSIYDDWYYYGGNVSRHSWTSGFGGSYWWGYEPWWGYNSRIGYGWSSWYNNGISYSVNYYLGRPHYHYPVAYSSWNSHRYGNYSRPLTVINNNTYNYYYGSEKRNSNQGRTAGYNPANPSTSGRRTGYTATGGRSSSAGTAPVSSGSTGTQAGTRTGTRSSAQTGTRSGTQTGTRSTSQSGNQGNTQTNNQGGNTGTGETAGEKDKNNNGLRMGQHRRGVAEPPEPGDNNLPRTNNPNVNDRTDPGMEKENPSRGNVRQQTGTPSGSSPAKETNARKTRGKKSENLSETTVKGTESRKTSSSSKRRR